MNFRPERRARGAALLGLASLLLGSLAFLTACGNRSESPPAPERSAKRTPAESEEGGDESLGDRLARLEEEIRLREEFVTTYSRLLDDVLVRLDKASGTKRSEAVDAQGDPVALETAIDARFDALEKRMASIAKERELRQETRTKETAEQRAASERLRGEARAAQERVAALEKEIASLRDRTARAEERAASLEKQNGAFVIAASPGELRALRKADVVRKRLNLGGDLEMSTKALGVGETERTIKAIDGTAKVIYLGSRVATARVVSDHRNYTELYTIDKKDGQLAVIIRDPIAFWRVSRYLIVEVEGS